MARFNAGDVAPEAGVFLVVHRNGESTGDWRVVKSGARLPADIPSGMGYSGPLDSVEAEAARAVMDSRGSDAPLDIAVARQRAQTAQAARDDDARRAAADKE